MWFTRTTRWPSSSLAAGCTTSRSKSSTLAASAQLITAGWLSPSASRLTRTAVSTWQLEPEPGSVESDR